MGVFVAGGVGVAVLVGVGVSVGIRVLVGVEVTVKVGLGVLVGVDVGWLRASRTPLRQTKIPATMTAITAMTATTRTITRVLVSLIAPPWLIRGEPTQFCAEVKEPQRRRATARLCRIWRAERGLLYHSSGERQILKSLASLGSILSLQPILAIGSVSNKTVLER
jgi:hypothetical protein